MGEFTERLGAENCELSTVMPLSALDVTASTGALDWTTGASSKGTPTHMSSESRGRVSTGRSRAVDDSTVTVGPKWACTKGLPLYELEMVLAWGVGIWCGVVLA